MSGKLGINLTGDNELDRLNIFNYIVDNFSPDYTEAEILVLAATFLGKDARDIHNEIRINPDVLVPVCLHLIKEEKINLARRAVIGDALVRYSDAYGRALGQKGKKKPQFSFSNEYEEAIYGKLSGQNPRDVAVSFPFNKIYYERGLIYETMEDYQNAFRLYSKAHQWNPFNPKPIIKILDALKHDRRPEDLLRLAQWYLQVVYSMPNISIALRYAAYAYYLMGNFQEAYAYYYQSIVYDESIPPFLNEEIASVLAAMKIAAPYELTRKEIKNLFAFTQTKPFPSEAAFDTIRTLIIDHYNNERYVDVLRYATHYVIHRPYDDKINRILKVSKLKLD